MESVTRKVRAPDGNTYDVVGPADAPDEQFFRYLKNQLALEETPEEDIGPTPEEKYKKYLEEKERRDKEAEAAARRKNAGFFENIATGFGRGVVDVGEITALGGATLLDEEAELDVREDIQGIASALRPEGGDPEAISSQLAGGLGSIVGFAVPAIGAAALAPSAFLASMVGLGVGGTLGIGAARGEASERAREAGVSEAVRQETIDSPEVFAAGAIEALPLGRALKLLKIDGIDNIVRKLGDTPIDGEKLLERVGQRVVSAGTTGIAEGAQEAASAVLQNLAEQGYNPERELVDSGVLEEAAIGGGAGAIFQGLVDLFAGRRRRGPTGEPSPDEEVELTFTDGENTTTIQTTRANAEIIKTRRAAKEAGEETPSAETLTPVFTPEDIEVIDSDLNLVSEQVIEPAPTQETPGVDESVVEGAVVDEDLDGPSVEAEAAEATAVVADERRLSETAIEAAVDADPTLGIQRPEAVSQEDFDAVINRAVQDVVESDGTVNDAIEQTGDAIQRNAPEYAPLYRDAVDRLVQASKEARGERQRQTAEEGLSTEQQQKMAAVKAAAEQQQPNAPSRQGLSVTEMLQQGDGAQEDIEVVNFGSAASGQTDAPVVEGTKPLAGVAQTDINIQTDAVPVQPATADVEVKKKAPKKKAVPRKPKVVDTATAIDAKSYKTQWAQRVKREGTKAMAQTVSDGVDDVANNSDRAKVRTEVEAKLPTKDIEKEVKEVNTAVTNYFGRYPTISGALRAIVHDNTFSDLRISTDERIPSAYRNQKEKESEVEGVPEAESALDADTYELITGTGSKNAELALSWARNNLSEPVQRQIDALEQKEAASLLRVLNNHSRRVSTNEVNEAISLDVARQEAEDIGLADSSLDLTPQEIERIAAATEKLKRKEAEIQQAATSEDARAMGAESKKSKAVSRQLIAQADERIIRLLSFAMSRRGKDPETRARIKQKILEQDELIQLQKEFSNLLRADAISNLDVALHPDALAALQDGNLREALRVMTLTSLNPTFKFAAVKLEEAVEGINIKFKKNLKDAKGMPVAGMYDAGTNTITLDSDVGVTAHPVLHEITHALTVGVLTNKSSPVTKKLQAIYDDVKDVMSDGYALGSLEEFVAEAFSNPTFQAELGRVKLRGVTLWERFYNAVINFMRNKLGLDMRAKVSMMDKPLSEDSALTEVDQLITAIIAATPEAREAGIIEVAAAHDKLEPIVERIGEKIPPKDREKISKRTNKRIADTIASGTPAALKELLGVVPLLNLGQEAKRFLPSAPKVNDLVNEMAGSIAKMVDKVNNTAKPITQWMQNNPTKLNTFIDMQSMATLYEVDPELSRVEAAAKYKKNGEKKTFAQWEQTKKLWDELGKDEAGREGQRHFKTMLNTYKSMRDMLMASLDSRINAAVSDPNSRKIIRKTIYDKIFAGGVIDPFLPLSREGEYWVAYYAKDPVFGNRERYVESFETEKQRDAAVAELKELGVLEPSPDPTKESFETFESSHDKKDWKNAVPAEFVEDITTAISGNLNKFVSPEAAKELENEFIRLYIQSLPQSSLAKGFTARKGVRGFRGDLTPREEARRKKAAVEGRVSIPQHDPAFLLMQRGNAMARQLVQMEYVPQVNALMEQLKAEAKKDGGSAAKAFLGEFDKRADFIKNPNVENWANWLTSLGFNWTLGFNISSAAIQTTAVPLIAYPILGGKYGFDTAFKELGTALKLFTNSGLSRNADVYGPKGDERITLKGLMDAPPCVSNIDYDAPQNKGIRHHKTLVKVMEANAMTLRSQTQELLELEAAPETTPKFAGLVRIPRSLTLQSINKYSSLMFSNMERMARQTTAIAAYNLELAKLKAAGRDVSSEEVQAEAANTAIFLTELTNSSIATGSAPRWGQTHIGKVIFLFKRYGLAMNMLFIQLGREAISGDPSLSPAENAQLKRVAARQFGAIFASAFAMSGAAGLPAYGLVTMLLDLFLFDDEEERADTRVRQTIGEPLYGGPFNFLGVDVSTRIGLSDLIWRESFIDKDQSALWKLAELFGGPVLGVTLQMERGAQDINRGEIWRGVETMLPSSIKNVSKSARIAAAGGVETRRGDTIIDDLNLGEIGFQAMGFMPTRYSYELQKTSAKKRLDKALTAKAKKLTGRYFYAVRTGNVGEARKVMKDILAYNKRHPTAAISSDTLKRSVRSRFQVSRRMQSGVTYSRRNEERIRQLDSDFDENSTFWERF